MRSMKEPRGTLGGSNTARPGLLQRLTSPIAFSITNEDHQVLQDALCLVPESSVLCIASAGDTPLNLLSLGPARVEAVDSSFPQICLAALKVEGMRGLDLSGFHELMGLTRGTGEPLARYRQIREQLTLQVRRFWDRHDRIIARGVLWQGGMMKMFGLVRALLPLAIGPDGVAALERIETPEEGKAFCQRYLRNGRLAALLRVLLDRRALRSVYPVQDGLEGRISPHELAMKKIEAALTSRPVAGNPYIFPFIFARYPSVDSLPPYLSAVHFDTIRERLDRLHLHHIDVSSFLRGLPAQSFDAFALSNVVDWLDCAEQGELFEEVLRAARPQARVLSLSRASSASLVGFHGMGLERDAEQSERLGHSERSGYYHSLDVLIRRPHSESAQLPQVRRRRPRVLLIAPTALDMHGRPIRTRRLHLPALTLPVLASVTPPHVELRCVCDTVEAIPYDEPWDLVGVTSMGSGIVRAWQIADSFRRRGVKVVLGGIAASLSEPALSHEHVDSVVVGEAEEIWPQVVDDAVGGQLQPIYRPERRPPIGAIAQPRYDVLPRGKLGFWRPVQTTRGCPFGCRFCSVTAFFERTYRKVPIDHVLRDIHAAKRHGGRYIAFIDDNIGVDFKHCQRLFEALIPERIIWISQCSLEIAERPDILELAYASGCRLLSFGIESVNAESLRSIGKQRNRPERYAEAFATIRRHGIDVSTEMMLGLDGDGPDVFADTYRFLMDNRISTPRIHIITPIPGTPLFDELTRDGRILSHDYGLFSGGRVVFRPRNIEPEALQQGYWRLYEKLFSRRAILRRVGGNPAHLGARMRAFVIGVNLHYRNHIRRRICPGIV